MTGGGAGGGGGVVEVVVADSAGVDASVEGASDVPAHPAEESGRRQGERD